MTIEKNLMGKPEKIWIIKDGNGPGVDMVSIKGHIWDNDPSTTRYVIDNETEGKRILSIKMDENDAGAETIGDYLKALLRELWNKGEGFSGKRPFGNSDWEREIYDALELYGIDSEIENYDNLIFDAIEAL